MKVFAHELGFPILSGGEEGGYTFTPVLPDGPSLVAVRVLLAEIYIFGMKCVSRLTFSRGGVLAWVRERPRAGFCVEGAVDFVPAKPSKSCDAPPPYR